jgi:cell division protein FtsI/penicillin-binding protein 2
MNETSWRSFQSGFILEKKRKNFRIRMLKTGSFLLCLAALGLAIAIFVSVRSGFRPGNTAVQGADSENPGKTPVQLSKKQLSDLLATRNLSMNDKPVFAIRTPGLNCRIFTTIDTGLQQYLLSMIHRAEKLERGKPRQIAMVVMEAATGRIIAMSGYDLENPDADPCLEAVYPAASLFKIVTASAAVETLNYTPSTRLYFNGSKYTLYKRQLKDVKNRYSCGISLAKAFAESVNPVFGKIGKNHLGSEKLKTYAQAFGFNQKVDSELNFTTGIFDGDASGYHLAELGCGFNRKTKISPVFGAMLVSAVVNKGNIPVPAIVDRVIDDSGKIIYQYHSRTYKRAIQPETASAIMKMMEKTVSRGTARKSFRKISRDRILSNLTIGGKTGSIYNRAHTIKYDWFTGFGRHKKTKKKIVMSIVVGHGRYIGTRAGTYAKIILKQYFSPETGRTKQL